MLTAYCVLGLLVAFLVDRQSDEGEPWAGRLLNAFLSILFWPLVLAVLFSFWVADIVCFLYDDMSCWF